MKPTEQTIQQLERAIKKIAQKYPYCEEPEALTDIHLVVSQDSGELLVYDDDDNEITRCIVEQWIDSKEEFFYENVTATLRSVLKNMHETVDSLGIMKPYSFVLENDEKEHMAELFLADDDTIIVGHELMENLDSELNTFLDNLLKE